MAKPSDKRKSSSQNNTNCSTPKNAKLSDKKGIVSVVERISPLKALHDPNEYVILRLSNGLLVSLISRKAPKSGDDSDASPSTSSEANRRLGRQSRSGCICGEKEGMDNDQPIPDFDVDEARHFGGSRRELNHTSVAMTVNCGAADDPETCQGLAHLTEHVVHFGSQQFPKEAAHSEMVFNFGLAWNAFTQPHLTTYYHDVPDSILEQTLPLFSDMLSQPEFKTDLINREVHAVDSEFYLNHGFYRSHLPINYAFVQNKSHPFARFTCGNEETLRSSKLVGTMKTCHRQNYVASAMSLCINSTKTLTELENLTLEHFSDLPLGERKRFQETSEDVEKLKLKCQLQAVVIEGISEKTELKLTWMLDPWIWIEDTNDLVILSLICTMLSDTSKSSLEYYLKNEELIWSMGTLTTGSDHKYTTVFHLSFFLTPKGHREKAKVLRATLGFILKLNSVSELEMRRLFEEIKIHHQQQFYYGLQDCSNCTHTYYSAINLQFLEKSENLLTSSSWTDATFNYEKIMKALKLFMTETPLISLVLSKSDNFKETYKTGKADTTPHTLTNYKLVSRDKEGFTENPSKPPTYPFKFIPPNDLLQLKNGGGDCNLAAPINYGDIEYQQFQGSSSGKVLVGVHYGHQKIGYDPYTGAAIVQFLSPTVYTSVRSHALCCLWTSVIRESISEFGRKWNLAGYKVFVSCNGDAISVMVQGFPEYMLGIMDCVLNSMFEDVTEKRFNLAKEALNAQLEMNMEHSSVLVSQVLNSMLFHNQQFTQDAAGYVNTFTLNDLKNAVILFKRTSAAIVILLGNVPLDFYKTIENSLEKRDFSPRDITPRPQIVDINMKQLHSPGEWCVRVKSPSSAQPCTTVCNVYILGKPSSWTPDEELFMSGMDFMFCQAFLHLRTKRQLGYAIHARNLNFYNQGLPLMMFSVEVVATSERFTPCELDAEIEEFLMVYPEHLANIPDDQFATMKRLKGIADDITKEDVAAWFKNKFGKAESNRCSSFNTLKWHWRNIRKLSIQVVAHKGKACSCEKCNGVESWTPGVNKNSQLLFACGGQGQMKDYFINKF